MSILLVCNTKGGVGKSTSIINIAVTLASQSHDLIIVDADHKQTSVSEWAATRKLYHPERSKLTCIQAKGFIHEDLLDLNTRYKYVLVDAPGYDCEELRSALAVCDTALIPVRASQLDLNVLHTMSKMIRDASIINKKLLALAFISFAPTSVKNKEIEMARKVIIDYPEISLLRNYISDRKCFRDTWAEGLGVIESTEKSASITTAKQEVINLVSEVCHATGI
jgi:chromosome partitioning protein